MYSFGNSLFDGGDGFQAYLIFQPAYKYFKTIINTDYISSWKSNGLSTESIKTPTTSDNSLTPALSYYDYNIRVKLTGNCLKITYTHKRVVNTYIVYELSASSFYSGDPTLKNCLFGAVTLTKNTDIDKYGYSGYGNGFDRRSNFTSADGGFGQNLLIFGADMSSSTHIDNKIRHISSGKRTNTRIRTYINCRKNISHFFTVTKKKFCLSLEKIATYFLMVKKL